LAQASDLSDSDAHAKLVSLAVEHAIAARIQRAGQAGTVRPADRYALIAQILDMVEKFGPDPALAASAKPARAPSR